MTPLDYAGLINRLEAEVDATCFHDVVEALVEVCRLKAEHLRSNWQDIPSSQAWNRRAGRLERVAENG